MARGRKRKEYTAHRTQENMWYFYDSNEKLIDSCEAKLWHNDYKEFGYKYRTDFMVDLFVYEKFGSYKEIESVGGLKVYQGKTEWNLDMRKELCIQHREGFKRNHLKQLEKKHNEANKKAYERHYNNYLESNKNRLEAEIKKYDDLLVSFENQASDYKNLNKILKNHRVYLNKILRYGINQMKEAEGLNRMQKDKYTISISVRHLAELVDDKNNFSMASRVVNLLCLLGFFSKEFDIAEKHYKKIREKDLHKMTYLSLNNEFSFEKAEEVAKTLYQNFYKIRNFSKSYVENVFGQETADKIFSTPEIKPIEEQEVTEEKTEEIIEEIFFQQQANKLALENPILDLTYDEFYEDDFDIETPF